MSEPVDELAYRTVETTAPTITIPLKEYDQLVSSGVFLSRIIGDQGFMGYDELYPELLEAAGFVDADDEEDGQVG
jgi:hypothetical protein